MQTQTNRRIKSDLAKLQAMGAIPIELQSVSKLATNGKTMDFFRGADERGGYGQFAHYGLGGKNPIVSQRGKLVGFQMGLHGPNFAALNYAGATGTFDVLHATNKLFNLLRYKITKNKTVLREGAIKSIIEPIPTIVFPLVVGAGVVNGTVPVTAVESQTGNIEERDSKQRALYLPIDFEDNDSFLFEMWMPSGGLGVDLALNDHLLVVTALGVEFPK